MIIPILMINLYTISNSYGDNSFSDNDYSVHDENSTNIYVLDLSLQGLVSTPTPPAPRASCGGGGPRMKSLCSPQTTQPMPHDTPTNYAANTPGSNLHNCSYSLHQQTGSQEIINRRLPEKYKKKM